MENPAETEAKIEVKNKSVEAFLRTISDRRFKVPYLTACIAGLANLQDFPALNIVFEERYNFYHIFDKDREFVKAKGGHLIGELIRYIDLRISEVDFKEQESRLEQELSQSENPLLAESIVSLDSYEHPFPYKRQGLKVTAVLDASEFENLDLPQIERAFAGFLEDYISREQLFVFPKIKDLTEFLAITRLNFSEEENVKVQVDYILTNLVGILTSSKISKNYLEITAYISSTDHNLNVFEYEAHKTACTNFRGMDKIHLSDIVKDSLAAYNYLDDSDPDKITHETLNERIKKAIQEGMINPSDLKYIIDQKAIAHLEKQAKTVFYAKLDELYIKAQQYPNAENLFWLGAMQLISCVIEGSDPKEANANIQRAYDLGILERTRETLFGIVIDDNPLRDLNHQLAHMNFESYSILEGIKSSFGSF